MMKFVKTILISALLFTGCASIEPKQTEAATVSQFNSGRAVSNYQLNMEILKLINKERRAYGIAPLRYNNNRYISNGTNQRANEITRYFAHYRPNGTLFNTAFARSVKPYVSGENALKRSLYSYEQPSSNAKQLARTFYNQWYKSPGHRQNMLRSSFRGASLSVKVAYDAKKKRNCYYAVQIFTTK